MQAPRLLPKKVWKKKRENRAFSRVCDAAAATAAATAAADENENDDALVGVISRKCAHNFPLASPERPYFFTVYLPDSIT